MMLGSYGKWEDSGILDSGHREVITGRRTFEKASCWSHHYISDEVIAQVFRDV